MTITRESIYGGLSGAKIECDSFDLGEGTILRKTFAHFTSPYLVAFSPPTHPGAPHPAPWKPARGGFGFDVEIELKGPDGNPLGENFTPPETIWWIVALLRLGGLPFLSVPILSNHPFNSIPNSEKEPELRPFETEARMFGPPDKSVPVIGSELLEWAKSRWIPAGRLLNTNRKFHAAMKAFDYATVRGKSSASLLAMWGALEQLFSPSPGELRFRVACLMSSYLEPPGQRRFALYKELLQLYDKRSVAAHTASEAESVHVVQTYVLMRNALMLMIEENQVPTRDDLEAMLFSCLAGPSPPGWHRERPAQEPPHAKAL